MRIAIIGMGTAGVSLLKELVKYNEFEQMEVDVYDNPKTWVKVCLFKMTATNY